MKRVFILLAAMVAVISMGAANAGDAAAGKSKSALCASCHGPDGVSANPLWPNLAGQKDQYLIKQLKEFRDGVRNDPLMSPMSLNLTDEDIADLAAYYSSQQSGS